MNHYCIYFCVRSGAESARDDSEENVELEKSNVLLMGPTGSGKNLHTILVLSVSYLCKSVTSETSRDCQLIEVPILEAVWLKFSWNREKLLANPWLINFWLVVELGFCEATIVTFSTILVLVITNFYLPFQKKTTLNSLVLLWMWLFSFWFFVCCFHKPIFSLGNVETFCQFILLVSRDVPKLRIL